MPQTLVQYQVRWIQPRRPRTRAWYEFLADLKAILEQHSSLSLKEYTQQLGAQRYPTCQAKLLASATREWFISTEGRKPLGQARKESTLGPRKLEVETLLRIMPNYLSDWDQGEGHYGEPAPGNFSVVLEKQTDPAAFNVSFIAAPSSCHVRTSSLTPGCSLPIMVMQSHSDSYKYDLLNGQRSREWYR